MQALLDYKKMPWRRISDMASLRQFVQGYLAMEWRKQRGQVLRYGGMDPTLDEYPTVPFYSLDGQSYYYDSTSLADHLDSLDLHQRSHLLTPQDPALGFVARLIDEALDEFGLYMAHHNRWVVSATTNTMGEFTAAEIHVPAALRQVVAQGLARRQARRCAYLFSVAPPGFDAGVPASIQPPTKAGFPPTHELLDRAWLGYLSALESLLNTQPFLLGQRFTLADASVYGQFSMNLVDGRAAELMQEKAPRTHAWLCMIRDGGHRKGSDQLSLSPELQPLLEMIGCTFIPLMRANLQAWEEALAQGQVLFNEDAFHRGQALYEGQLLGYPYRHVVKTFQVAVWQKLLQAWSRLPQQAIDQLQAVLPQSILQAFEAA